MEICATWPELQGPASGSHSPKHFQMDLFITSKPEAALSCFSSLPSLLLEQALAAPFHSGNQQETGMCCTAQLQSSATAAWAPFPLGGNSTSQCGCTHAYLAHLDSFQMGSVRRAHPLWQIYVPDPPPLHKATATPMYSHSLSLEDSELPRLHLLPQDIVFHCIGCQRLWTPTFSKLGN